jgi:uncharacterized protein YpiB (UPF0302 family)
MDNNMQKFMKKYYTNTPMPEEKEINMTDSVLAEFILEQSLREFRKKEILKEIDQTLTNRNKDEFYRLVTELESLS